MKKEHKNLLNFFSQFLLFVVVYHDWKRNANFFIHFNNEQHSQAHDLNDGEQVYFDCAHVTQENVIGLMLLWHKNENQSMHELNAVKR